MTLRLDPGVVGVVADLHDTAATTIDGSAHSAPAGVDAGLGAAHVADILAAVSETAGEIATINAAVGVLVLDAADDIGRTEDEVGRQFDSMRGVGE